MEIRWTSMLRWRKLSVKIRAFLRLLLFYICFRSLLINTRLVFISYFVPVPLRKGHRGLEYKCSFFFSFVPVFSAFLIICIETLVFVRFFFLHFWLFTLRLLVFVDCFVTLFKSMTCSLAIHFFSHSSFSATIHFFSTSS